MGGQQFLVTGEEMQFVRVHSVRDRDLESKIRRAFRIVKIRPPKRFNKGVVAKRVSRVSYSRGHCCPGVGQTRHKIFMMARRFNMACVRYV